MGTVARAVKRVIRTGAELFVITSPTAVLAKPVVSLAFSCVLSKVCLLRETAPCPRRYRGGRGVGKAALEPNTFHCLSLLDSLLGAERLDARGYIFRVVFFFFFSGYGVVGSPILWCSSYLCLFIEHAWVKAGLVFFWCLVLVIVQFWRRLDWVDVRRLVIRVLGEFYAKETDTRVSPRESVFSMGWKAGIFGLNSAGRPPLSFWFWEALPWFAAIERFADLPPEKKKFPRGWGEKEKGGFFDQPCLTLRWYISSYTISRAATSP